MRGLPEFTNQKVIKEDAPLTALVLYRIRAPLGRYLRPQLKKEAFKGRKDNKKQFYRSQTPVKDPKDEIRQWGGRDIPRPGQRGPRVGWGVSTSDV